MTVTVRKEEWQEKGEASYYLNQCPVQSLPGLMANKYQGEEWPIKIVYSCIFP